MSHDRTNRPKAPDRRILAGLAAGAAAVTLTALSSVGADARSTAIPSNQSAPTVGGTAVAGETLTASPGSWTGTPPIAYAFVWERCDAGGASCGPIAGETAQSYTVTTGDIGSTLRVVVTATNPEGSASASSATTAVVSGQTAPVNTAEPVISGTTVEGSTLSTTTGTWTGTSITFAYQWVRCDAGGGLPDGSDCPSIPGATGSSYTLTADDVGHRLRVQVTASNGAGSAAGISNASDTVTQSTSTGPPHNTVEPSLSGTPAVGRALFASVGVWSGAPTLSYAYQWLRCDADGGLPDGSNCEVISGATTSSFIPSTTDVGRRLRVRVSASNGEGTETVASNASAAVQTSSTVTPVAQAPRNTFLPSILGSPAVAATLSASLGLWTGASPLLYTYQWLSCDATGGTSTGSGCPPIAGATATQYAPTAAMLGRRLRFQVTARNTFGTATATSNASAQVQAAGSTPPPPTGGALPPGAIRLPGGKVSIPVTSVSPPQRLVAGGITFAPNPVRSRARPIVLRVQVVDTRGYVIRDALVFVRSTPLVTSSGGEVRSGRDGWATVRFTPLTSFPLDGKSVQFFVRARKATDPLLAGVSSRRLVQVSTARTAR